MEIAIPLTGKVNAKDVNKDLLSLPAKTYLDLFQEMYKSIYGYPPLMNCGGCVGSLEDGAEDNAKYYEEQPRVSKSYTVGDSL